MMIIFLKRFALVFIVIGAFMYGRHTGVEKSERSTLVREIEVRQEIEKLAYRLRAGDEALLIEQKRVATVQRDEVIKYVTKYKTKIVEVPGIVDCVDNSGLLDLINATTPTTPSVKPTE